MARRISCSLIDRDMKEVYLERLSKTDLALFYRVYQSNNEKITGKDLKFIICFDIDMNVKDISLLFNIEPTSVHTARYRIKKKHPYFRTIL